jgi:hypothetical protein
MVGGAAGMTLRITQAAGIAFLPESERIPVTKAPSVAWPFNWRLNAAASIIMRNFILFLLKF